MIKCCGSCKFFVPMRPVDLSKPAGTLGLCQYHHYHKQPHALRNTLMVNEHEDGRYCPTHEPVGLPATTELQHKAEALAVEIKRVELRLASLREQLDAARLRTAQKLSA